MIPALSFEQIGHESKLISTGRQPALDHIVHFELGINSALFLHAGFVNEWGEAPQLKCNLFWP
jgi:hypothetical protein